MPYDPAISSLGVEECVRGEPDPRTKVLRAVPFVTAQNKPDVSEITQQRSEANYKEKQQYE